MSDHLFKDPPPSQDILDKASRVRLLIMDVDGVLTDGSIVYSADGNEIKAFHVWDGFAIKILHRFGIHTAIISGRSSNVVALRAAELDISEVHQGRLDKVPVFEETLNRLKLTPSQVCMIGDDLPDIPLLSRAGFSAMPANGHPRLRHSVDYIALCKGGGGVVREITEVILQAQDKIEEYWRLFPA